MEEASSSSQPAFPLQASIHVRGVPFSALDEDLENHFERYGEVVWAVDVHDVPWDSDGKAACVVFADPAAVNCASASWEKNNHIILGKMVEVACFSDRLQRRIETYDLPPSATCSLLRDYFEKFGVVTEAYAAPNGWGYVVFKWVESAHEVLRKKRHLFCGTEVMVRRPSLLSNALLDTNVPQNDLGGTTTPYDAPSYNQPTTAIPHTYINASTTPFSTSNNQWINATKNASDAPSFTPFGAPYTSFFNRPISATSCANTAPNTFFYDLAVRKENQIAESSRNNSNKGIIPNGKRIFVGGLPTNITDDEFRAYFEKFGPLTDAIVMKNKITNAPRGFGFVTFQTRERAHEVLKNQFHELRSDKKVEVKIAIRKSRNNSSSSSYSVQNYNPTINNFPPSEYTPYTLINQTAMGYPQSICNYNYPYTWYHPIGYGPMGYPPMGLYYINPNITGYDSQMQPADNFQNGGHHNNAYNNSINLSFRGYNKGYTNGGNSTRVANLANERASPSINTAETSKPRAADKASDSNEEQ